MLLKYDSKIKYKLKGRNGDIVFVLANGSKWKQKKDNCKYEHTFGPKAKIWSDGKRYFLELDGMNKMIEVQRI